MVKENKPHGKPSSNADSPLFQGREDFIQIFKRGAEFYEDLLKENEKLRYRNAEIEGELATLNKGIEQGGFVVQLKDQVKQLEAERQDLLQKFKEVEAFNDDYKERYSAIEEEHNTLANLYIASYQLHSTLNFKEVTRIILEIAINLIGIGRLVLYVYDAAKDRLIPVAGDGLGEDFSIADLAPVPKGEGLVGEVLSKAEAFVAEKPDAVEGLVAALPLKAGDRCVGVLALERLLQQKSAWTQVDYELFTLLSAHAGTALLASALNTAFTGEALAEDRLRGMMAESE